MPCIASTVPICCPGSSPTLTPAPRAGSAGGSLSEELQAGCPAYFKQADKTYYEASELLARAGHASGGDQATLLSQAVDLMLKVPSLSERGAVLRQGLPH